MTTTTRTRAEVPQVFVAKVSGFLRAGGESYTLRQGITRIRAGHPLLRAYPSAFEPLRLDYEVEQATAAPGEKRGE